MPSAPHWKASMKAAFVFSGAYAEAPRWPMMRGPPCGRDTSSVRAPLFTGFFFDGLPAGAALGGLARGLRRLRPAGRARLLLLRRRALPRRRRLRRLSFRSQRGGRAPGGRVGRAGPGLLLGLDAVDGEALRRLARGLRRLRPAGRARLLLLRRRALPRRR